MKKVYYALIAVAVVVAVVAFYALNELAKPELYFDDASPVMYFWSASCHWCQKQKPVLEGLASEGFRVKSMNVVEDRTLWQKYDVKGTPTFLAENGDRLTGYQEESVLKPWLKAHGAKIGGAV